MLGVIDLNYLKELLPLLKAQGVSSLKMGTLELLFRADTESGESKDALQELPTSEQFPVDLRTDGAAGYDNLLFHSASPSQQEVPLPGLGEEEL